jgi:hypothetical protein
MGVTVKIIDRGWEKIKKELGRLDDSSTNVGLFGNGGDASSNIAERAAIQELGSRRWKDSRGRPFMRQAFDDNQREIEKRVVKEYGKVVDLKTSPRQALRRIGTFHEGNIKLEISTGMFRPLAPATIRAKKSSRPLIDTGQLRGAVQHKEKMR